MLTKVRIAGHPIHPMLVAFPVALYVATAAALIVFGGTHDPFWYRAAFWTNLSGVVMAAVAAIPGSIDLFGLPRRSRARVTGYIHALFNVTALGLFVISVIIIGFNLYGGRANVAFVGPLVLSLFGCLATVCAGWFGWRMVQTHHVGVKPTTHAAQVTSYADVEDLDEVTVPPVVATYASTGEQPMTH
jgi:uncharacterized membrane protein